MSFVLIIDDDAEMANLIGDVVGLGDYRSVHVDNGIDGLRLLAEESPELLILDIDMPVMSGWDVYKQLRTFSNIPVIFVTLAYSEEGKLKAADFGAKRYLNKQNLMWELLPAIRYSLGSDKLPV